MNALKPRRQKRDIVVRIVKTSGRTNDVIVRDTRKIIRLEGRHYQVYQIVQPEGYEKEEIYHLPDRSQEALLSLVFEALAEASRSVRRPGRA
jgi:hypothetical protein